MSKQSDAVKRWRDNSKRRIVEAMGGGCQLCGYNKCVESLDLHHIDPEEKEIALGSIRRNPKSWNTIVKELRKCILLCSNCHKEVHYGYAELPSFFASFDETYSTYQLHEKDITYCPVCGKEKHGRNKTCSYACSASLKGTVDWNSINLTEELKTRTKTDIARQLGCSDVAVYKRLKRIQDLDAYSNIQTLDC